MFKQRHDNERQYRILLFPQKLGLGGLERMVLNLAESLLLTGTWKVFLFCHDEETINDADQPNLRDEFNRLRVPMEVFQKGPGFSFRTVWRLVRTILRNQIQVVHSHDLGTLIYAVIGKILVLGKLRLVHTQHSFVHLKSHNRYKLYERIFTAFANDLVVVNDSLVKTYQDLGIPASRIHVIPNGVSFVENPVHSWDEKLHFRRQALDTLPTDLRRAIEFGFFEDRWLLYLARIHPIKGQRRIAALWSALPEALRRKTLLLVVGPESFPSEVLEVTRSLENVPDRSRVVLIPGTLHADVWIRSAELFLSCSEFEGMPLGPIEAIGSGLPSLLSRIPGHEFLAETARMYPIEDPSEAARQIGAEFECPDFRSNSYYDHHWKQGAPLRNSFSKSKMTRRYISLYLDLPDSRETLPHG